MQRQQANTIPRSQLKALALKCYDTDMCSLEEFEKDFSRVKTIKRLVTKYRNGHELKYRIVLNHLVVLYNVFDPKFVAAYLDSTIDNEEDRILINTLLVFMQRSLNLVDVDQKVIEALKAEMRA